MNVKINFVIGQCSEEEINALKNEQVIVSKMILNEADYELFEYTEGENIQVETANGDRLWCTIIQLERVINDEKVILIFTLEMAPSSLPRGSSS
jgi:hypothetical protein